MTTRNIGAILNVSRYLGSIFLDLSFTFTLENVSNLQMSKSPHRFIVISINFCTHLRSQRYQINQSEGYAEANRIRLCRAHSCRLQPAKKYNTPCRTFHGKNQLLTAKQQSNNHNERRRRCLMKSYGKH